MPHQAGNNEQFAYTDPSSRSTVNLAALPNLDFAAADQVPINHNVAKIYFKTAVPQQPEIHVGGIAVTQCAVRKQLRLWQ
jgi:hypothetical protein